MKNNIKYIIEDNRIYGVDNSSIVCEINYKKIDNNTYDIYRTYVDPSYRNMGLALNLVNMAISEIRKKGYNINASCEYVKKKLALTLDKC